MKRIDIYNLQSGGIQLCTAHTLPPKAAFSLYRLKTVVEDEFKRFEEDRRKLIESVFGEPVQDVSKKRDAILAKSEMQRTVDERNFLDDYDAKIRKADDQLKELLDEDVDVSSVNPMSYEDWHKLQCENSSVRIPNSPDSTDILSRGIERVLENVLWKAPVEETPADNI